ncbi:MAG: carbohydrate binding domain-containing protein [Dehalococcoidales bacterium]|nr:carbohydrate binding domain-containing protein [Dehalococcoidales bacterium]
MSSDDDTVEIAENELYISGSTPEIELWGADATETLKIVNDASGGTANLYVEGSIGIGTSSPAEKLDVAGNIRLSNLINSVNAFGSLASNYGLSLQNLANSTPANGQEILLDESATNLIKNPRPATSGTTNWTCWVDAETCTTTNLTDSTMPGVGGHGIQFTNTGASSHQLVGTANNTDSTAVTSGQSYTASFWAKASTNRNMTLYLLRAASPWDGISNFPTVSVTTSWQKFVVTLVATATDNAWLDFDSSGVEASGTYAIANVLMENRAYATSYFDGAMGAGYAWTGTAHNSTSTRGTGTYIGTAASKIAFIDNTNSLLNIAGDASTSGSLVFRGTSPATIDILNGDRLDFQTSVGGDDGLAAKMTLSNGGNLGIGTTAPAYMLTVNDNTTTYATDFLQNNADGWGSYIWVNNADTDKDAFHVETTAGHPLVVKNSGNVGIGTTAPATTLDVRGTASVSSNLTVGGYITGANNTPLTLQASGAVAGNGGIGSIYFEGSDGIQRARLDTTAASSSAFPVDGNLVVSSNTTFSPGAISAVSQQANSGQADVTVASATNFLAGQLVLIIQMTGTGAGNWETQTIKSISSNTLTMNTNLTDTYQATGAQVQKIPLYGNVNVNTNFSLSAPAWNGTTGGVIWFTAAGSVTVSSNASINGVGLGFAGGVITTGGLGGNPSDTIGEGATVAGNGNNGASGSGPSTGQSGAGGNFSGSGGGGNGTGDVLFGGGSGGGGGGGTAGGGGGGAYLDSANGTNGASGAGGNGGSPGGGAFYVGGVGGSGVGVGGSKGTTYGSADLSLIYIGSGGGGGASGAGGGSGADTDTWATRGGNGGNGGNGGGGGAGGAIISINAPILSNSGIISANGANGSGGNSGNAGNNGVSSSDGAGGGGGGAGGAAGGGGSGGSIYLNARSITIGTVTAKGGVGGSTVGSGGAGGKGGNAQAGGGSYSGGGGGGGAGSTGGAAGAKGSNAVAGVNGAVGASAAPGAGSQGGNGRIRLDGNASGATTPASGYNGTYTMTSPYGYGTFFIGSVVTNSADVAETYRTLERDLDPGDVVIVDDDPNNPLYADQYVNKEGSGLARARQERDPRAVGIISTAPGLTLGGSDNSYIPPEEQKALALAGRVPVKIDPASPEIKVGDPLTTSVNPGRAIKATRAGPIIAKAVEPWTPPSSGQEPVDKISVMVNLSWYDPDALLTSSGDYSLSLSASASAYSTEFGALGFPIASGSANFLFNITDAVGNLVQRVGIFSEAAIAHLRAGFLQAKLLETNTIRLGPNEATGSANLLRIQDPNGQTVAGFDSLGNMAIRGTLYADQIIARNGTFGTLNVATISAQTITQADLGEIRFKLALLEQAASATPELSSADPIFAILNQAQTASPGGQLAGGGLGSPSGDLPPTELGDITIHSADILTNLNIGGNLTLAGNLAVAGTSQFTGDVSFLKGAIFFDDVGFLGKLTLNQDTAGFATIKQGDQEVQITFGKPYTTIPVVQASLAFDNITDEAARVAMEDAVLGDKFRYIVTRRTIGGFVIKLDKPADHDLSFSWLAFAVKDPNTFVSGPAGTPTPTPTPGGGGVSPTPTPTSSPPAGGPTDTPTPTPVVTDTPTPTP